MFFFTELTDKLLERKINLCTELLAVADILEPGASRLRGLLLYDLQAAKVVQAKRDLASEKILKASAQVSFCAWAETKFMIYFSSRLPVLLPHLFSTPKSSSPSSSSSSSS
jgi:hypothetical protein